MESVIVFYITVAFFSMIMLDSPLGFDDIDTISLILMSIFWPITLVGYIAAISFAIAYDIFG